MVLPVSRPERVLVALTGGPEGEVLLRHAARLPGAELHSVYVAGSDPGRSPDPAALVRLRGLTEDLGGVHHTVTCLLYTSPSPRD